MYLNHFILRFFGLVWLVLAFSIAYHLNLALLGQLGPCIEHILAKNALNKHKRHVSLHFFEEYA